MKEIPNQQFTVEDSTVSLLKTALNFIPKDGFDLAKQRAHNRVMDAIEKLGPGDVIKLEDADFATAQNAIKGVRWTTIQKHLITFQEQFAL